jgi:phage gpG-like protein
MPSNADDVARNIGKFGTKIEGDIVLKLEQAGEYIAGKMVDKISSGLSPGLKPATIAAKGSSTPLIDTGELISQVTHKMEGKDTVKIGVFGSRAEIAAVHELGAPSKNIPARSFARPSLKENQAGIIKILTQK